MDDFCAHYEGGAGGLVRRDWEGYEPKGRGWKLDGGWGGVMATQ